MKDKMTILNIMEVQLEIMEMQEEKVYFFISI